MDLINIELMDVVWLCYDYGIYTIEIATNVANEVAAVEPVSVSGALGDVCHELYLQHEAVL